MSATQVAMLALIAISAAVGMWADAKWLRTAFAAVLLGIQLLVLAVSFDVHARHALVAEIEIRGSVPEASHAVALVQDSQLSDRVTVALAGIGLFLLVALSPRSVRDSAQSRERRSRTSQD